MVTYTLAQLSDKLACSLHGDGSVEVSGIATLTGASATDISFLANQIYQKHLPTTKAAAVILDESMLESCATNALVCKNPHLAFAKLTQLFAPIATAITTNGSGAHPTAVVADDAMIADSAWIGPGCVVESGVKIGANCRIGANSVLQAGTVLGESCLLYAQVTLYHGVTLGDRVIIHSGTVIGSDGFGFASDGQGGWEKVMQLGGVQIGNDVEVGANVAIDRGAIEDTVIEDRVKIDNQVQIAHNVRIGSGTVVAGCVGIAGSTTIGRNCMIGGAAGFAGHIKVADNVVVTGMAMVTHSLSKPGMYSSGTGIDANAKWRRNAARFRQLDSMHKRLTRIESEQRYRENTDE